MNNVLDALISLDELTREQHSALQTAIESDPDFATLVSKWLLLREEVQASIRGSMPGSELMVLYALHQQDASILDEEERARLQTHIPQIQELLTNHPALSLVIQDIQSAQSDFVQLWDKHITSIHRVSAEKRTPLRLVQLYPVRIAAVFLLLVLSFFAVFSVMRSYQTETIFIAENEFRTIRFADGSKVRLVGASQLTYSKPGLLSSFDRLVQIDGNAFFDITPDEKPFLVESATAITEAKGTQFSVMADSANTEVVLTNGQVTVHSRQSDPSSVTLDPGQVSSVHYDAPPTPPATLQNMTDHLSWTGLFIFHLSPLDEVANHFSSHYDVRIDVAPEIADAPLKATFDPDTLSLDEALTTLSLAFNSEIVSTGLDSYLLTAP